jgi:uncharacterized protein
VAIPVSLVTGWDDVQLDQALGQYRRLREAGSDAWLIVCPWNHTSIFDKGYPVVFPRALEELRARLSGKPASPAGPRARVHVGGSGQWRDLPEGPLSATAAAFFRVLSTLSESPGQPGAIAL